MDKPKEVVVAVAPLVGVRIEIRKKSEQPEYKPVAPLVGVRIEIALIPQHQSTKARSLPSWECGLKSKWHILW